jgi:WD40 repeat protein
MIGTSASQLRCPQGHRWDLFRHWPLPQKDGRLTCPKCAGVLLARVAVHPQEAEDRAFGRLKWQAPGLMLLAIPVLVLLTWLSVSRRYVAEVAYAPDGQTLAVNRATIDGGSDVLLLDLKTGEPRHLLPADAKAVTRLAFSGDGKLLALAGTVEQRAPQPGQNNPQWEPGIHVWDPAADRERHTLRGGTNRPALLAFSHSDLYLLAVGRDQTMTWWEVTDAGHHQTATLPTPFRCLALSLGGDKLAAGEDTGDVSVWEITAWDQTSPKLIFRSACTSSPVVAVAFSPDGGSLAVAGELDDAVQIIDAGTGQNRASYQVPMTWLSCVAFSNDGTRLAVGGGSFSRNGQVLVYDTTNGILLHTFEVGTNTVRSVSFSPDGTRLAAGSGVSVSLLARQRNGRWYEWDLATGQPLASGD